MVARSVSIADLKDNLSTYLAEVRRGEEILVRDRRTPIAKITPLTSAADLDAEEAALATEGKLRFPSGPLPPSFFRLRAPRVSRVDLLRSLRAERDED